MPALASFYDHSSLVSSLTYGNGSTKSYVYDDQQRIKQTYVDNTLTSQYNYDRLGNLVKYSDAKTGITWNHEYDLIGRATRSDASDGRYIGYTYDSFNRLYTVKENVRGYELKTVYDYGDQCNYSEKSGLVTGLTMNNCRQFVYSYDKLNRLTSKTLLKSYGVKTTYSYLEGAGENTTTALIKSVNNDGELLEYAYDENGNITSVKKNGALLESYEYDALNQLTKVTRGSEVYTYTYDNAGNILSVKKNGAVIKDYGYSDPEWKDLLTSFNGQTITYDAIGNPLTYRDGMTMTWQSGRQLASINKDGLSATFAYDANGHRTQKTVNGVTTNYYWVGDRLQYMATGDDMYVFFYDDKGTPYGVFTLIDGVQEHLFYLYNAQGDVIAIINDYAERVVNYEYSAWGELLSVTGSKADTVGMLNPFRYRGYCYDTETGFYYVSSRYYDPEIGRWINADTTDILSLTYYHPGQYNLFSYCNNNPANDRDDDGQLSWLAKIAIGAAAIAVGVGVTALTGGAALPALAAGVKAACVAGAISAGTRATTTAVRSAVSGDSFYTVLQKSANAAVDGFADGFMAGGIAAGASQVASGGFKIAAKLGAKAGKSSGIKLGNTKILSPDAVWQKNNGGTLIKIGKTFRIDVGSNTLLHMHLPKVSSHIQIGTVLSAVYGGIYGGLK